MQNMMLLINPYKSFFENILAYLIRIQSVLRSRRISWFVTSKMHYPKEQKKTQSGQKILLIICNTVQYINEQPTLLLELLVFEFILVKLVNLEKRIPICQTSLMHDLGSKGIGFKGITTIIHLM